LIGYSVFPRAREFCTKTPLRVRLRRGKQKTPVVCIVKRDTNEIVNGTTQLVSMTRIGQVVKAIMDSLVQDGKYINDEVEILVKIQLPHCPNLDLLDLPGIVAAGAGKEETRNLVNSVIKKDKDHSIFLLIVEAKFLNTSTAASIFKDASPEMNVCQQTIGILTKIDELSKSFDIKAKFEKDNEWMPLKVHWMAAASQDPEVYSMDLERMLEMERRELIFLNEFPALRDSGFAGITVIKEKVQEMFEAFIVNTWVPSLKEKIFAELDQCLFYNCRVLGFPIPNDEDYYPLVYRLRNLCVRIGFSTNLDTLQLQSDNDFHQALNNRVSEVCKDIKWMKLESFPIDAKQVEYSAYLKTSASTIFSEAMAPDLAMIRSHQQSIEVSALC
jgi:hypothetical protein